MNDRLVWMVAMAMNDRLVWMVAMAMNARVQGCKIY
jgi:hypothetical protein